MVHYCRLEIGLAQLMKFQAGKITLLPLVQKEHVSTFMPANTVPTPVLIYSCAKPGVSSGPTSATKTLMSIHYGEAVDTIETVPQAQLPLSSSTHKASISSKVLPLVSGMVR